MTPKEIYELLKSKLEDKYSLCYVDYRDEVPANLIQRCVDKKCDEPLTEEDLYAENRLYGVKYAIEELMKKEKFSKEEIVEFISSDWYDELRYEIEDRDTSTPIKDCLNQTQTYAYVRFHSNYDCALPLWEQGGLYGDGTALSGIMAALSLNPIKVKAAAAKRGIKTSGRFRDIKTREGKEVVDYDAFIKVIIETPCYGNWSFFGKLDNGKLYENDFDVEKLTIDKGVTCCFFNWWNGSGSLEFCETLRPVSVKELIKRMAPYHDDLRLVIDDNQVDDYGYKPCDVYGCKLSEDYLFN